MTNFYSDSKVRRGLYSPPKYITKNIDFSDIPGKEFLVQEGDRLDIIAEQVYGRAEDWKAIAVYNNIGYFFDVKPGDIIKLPNNIDQVKKRL